MKSSFSGNLEQKRGLAWGDQHPGKKHTKPFCAPFPKHCANVFVCQCIVAKYCDLGPAQTWVEAPIMGQGRFGGGAIEMKRKKACIWFAIKPPKYQPIFVLLKLLL